MTNYLDLEPLDLSDLRSLGVELTPELVQLLTLPLEELLDAAGLVPTLEADEEHGGRAWLLSAPEGL